jgi:hypothetical protein
MGCISSKDGGVKEPRDKTGPPAPVKRLADGPIATSAAPRRTFVEQDTGSAPKIRNPEDSEKEREKV